MTDFDSDPQAPKPQSAASDEADSQSVSAEHDEMTGEKNPGEPTASTEPTAGAEAPAAGTEPQAEQETAADQPDEKPPSAESPAKPKDPEVLRAERVERFLRKQRKAGPVPSLKQDPTFLPEVPPDTVDAELERQLQEAMGGFDEAQLAGQLLEEPAPKPDKGKKVGRIVAIHGNDVFVDLPGSRSQGVLPRTQFAEKPSIGEEVEVQIEGYDEANGLLILTRKGAAVEADWSTVQPGMVVEARVIETNKGGLAVDVNGIRGFMPISQIDMYRVEKPEDYVNQRLLCEVVEVDPERRNLVVSRRVLLEREREEQERKLWEELAEGQVRDGIVRRVEDFGAFVDIGGVEGLLHVSEMSWGRVVDPRDVVSPGQRVKVAIIKLDRERKRISLSMKELIESPWDNIDEKYPIGRVVEGTVTRLADFGAFVELEPGIEGLVHISELANQRVNRVSDVVQVGDRVRVQVLGVDVDKKRISLSIRGAQKVAEEPEETPAAEEVEEEPPRRQPRKPKTPLRGGLGDNPFEGLL